MTKIPYIDLINIFKKMYDNKWGYIPNASGELWTQAKQDASTNDLVKKYGQQWVGRHVTDCSGAFAYAYKQFKQSIYQGSNRIARVYIDELLPTSAAKPGMAAFKFYAPGHKNYNLPSAYKKGGQYFNNDLNDYYHIGLVDETGQYILNSQSTSKGFTRSKIDSWARVGYLKDVAYSNINNTIEIQNKDLEELTKLLTQINGMLEELVADEY